MFYFLRCFVVKTKHDESEVECETPCVQYCDKSTQCDDLLLTKSVMVQCETLVNVNDASCQYDYTQPIHEEHISNQNVILEGKKTTVYLRDKALSTIAFDVYEKDGQKYIVIKNENVFLRHIKGHYKYDQPWQK